MSASTLLILICCCLATGASAYNSLFIGYSFFDPVAKQLPKLAEAARQDHTQTTVFSGGGSGTPIALWHDLKKSAVIKKALDTGKIELFGMPGWRTAPPPSKISDPTEGQDLWISYALSKNPKTKFMIGTAWEDFPAKYSTAAYTSETRAAKTVKWWKTFVAQLQAKHPGVTIIDNPYGLGAAELRLLYDAGVVKNVPRMFGTGIDDRANCMFYDEKGHGGNILHDLLAMFFLNRIYNVDLSAVDFSSALPWTTDLAKVAKSVLDAYDAGSVCGSDPCSPTAQLQLQTIRALESKEFAAAETIVHWDPSKGCYVKYTQREFMVKFPDFKGSGFSLRAKGSGDNALSTELTRNKIGKCKGL